MNPYTYKIRLDNASLSQICQNIYFYNPDSFMPYFPVSQFLFCANIGPLPLKILQ